jgi:hypothetical protein
MSREFASPVVDEMDGRGGRPLARRKHECAARCRCEGHNKFIRSHIGSDVAHGNHRLRSRIATYMERHYGESMATSYLRHSDGKQESRTARKHYIGLREFAELPTVCDAQILKWGRRHEERDRKA